MSVDPTRRLDSAWAKVERAKLHINALKCECTRVLKPDAEPLFSLAANFNFEGYFAKEIVAVRETPVLIGLLIGDAAYNLRCALEHLAFQLGEVGPFVRPKRNKRTGKLKRPLTQFVIADDKAAFDEAAPRDLQPMKPAHRTLIEDVQPYKRWCTPLPSGADPLAVLRDLSNSDKHRVVNATAIASTAASFEVRDTRDCIIERIVPNTQILGKPLKAKTELVRIYVEVTGPNPDVQVDAKGTAYIALDDGGEVVEALLGITTCVERILTLFDDAILPPGMERRP